MARQTKQSEFEEAAIERVRKRSTQRRIASSDFDYLVDVFSKSFRHGNLEAQEVKAFCNLTVADVSRCIDAFGAAFDISQNVSHIKNAITVLSKGVLRELQDIAIQEISSAAIRLALARLIQNQSWSHEKAKCLIDTIEGQTSLRAHLQENCSGKLLSLRFIELFRELKDFSCRTVFPVVADEEGALLEAVVWRLEDNPEIAALLQSLIPKGQQLVVLPWTSFYPRYGDKAYFPQVSENIQKAIENTDSTDNSTYFVTFETLHPNRFHEVEFENCSDAELATLFAPPVFQFDGPSCGFALGISALSAVERLTPDFCIASGEVQSTGTARDVGGASEKANVIVEFLSLANDASKCRVVLSASDESNRQVGKSIGDLVKPVIEPLQIRTISEFKDHLTDGFDMYRNFLTSRLKPRIADPAGEFVNELLLDLKTGRSSRMVISADIDDDPADIATSLLLAESASLSKGSGTSKIPGKNQSVLLPLDLAWFADACSKFDGFNTTVFADTLAKGVMRGVSRILSRISNCAEGLSRSESELPVFVMEPNLILRSRLTSISVSGSEIEVGKLNIIAFDRTRNETHLYKKQDAYRNAIKLLQRFLLLDAEYLDQSSDFHHGHLFVMSDTASKNWTSLELGMPKHSFKRKSV